MIKAYASEQLYMVQEVAVVNPYKKMSYRNRRRHTDMEASDSFNKKDFSQIFDEAMESKQPERIQIYTNGYTKDGLPYYNHINKREYC